MQLTIHDLAFGGDGVGRSDDGVAVFVPYTIPGETVEVEVLRRKKKFARGRLVSVVTPSPDRVRPECRYFGKCGGCTYQHISYEAQLRFKTGQVEQTLRRLGRLDDVPMRPAVASPKPYGYRNRIRVHHVNGVTGFYSADGRGVMDIAECPIASGEVNGRLLELRSRPLADGDYTLSERRETGFFHQTNDGVAAAMLEVVAGLITSGGRLVDAYCGAGFFAQALRERYEEVVGIEENEFAVAHARASAKPHERYIAGDVAEALPAVLSSGKPGRRTTVLLDPPAAGATARVLDTLLAAAPEEIVYISCDPATLARDLGALKSAYRLESVTPMDMFPQTAGIEVAVSLKRRV